MCGFVSLICLRRHVQSYVLNGGVLFEFYHFYLSWFHLRFAFVSVLYVRFVSSCCLKIKSCSTIVISLLLLLLSLLFLLSLLLLYLFYRLSPPCLLLTCFPLLLLVSDTNGVAKRNHVSWENVAVLNWHGSKIASCNGHGRVDNLFGVYGVWFFEFLLGHVPPNHPCL